MKTNHKENFFKNLHELLLLKTSGISLSLQLPTFSQENLNVSLEQQQQEFLNAWWVSYPFRVNHKVSNQANHQTISHIKGPQKFSAHPDILCFSQPLQKTELEQITAFQIHNPLYLSHKYIFFLSTQKLSNSASNKLLKLLESPPIPMHLIFLGHPWNDFLPTLKSRILCWRIKQSEWGGMTNLPHILKKITLESILITSTNTQEFHSLMEEHDYSEKDCLHYSFELLKNKSTTDSSYDQWIQLQQWIQQSQTFNNSLIERLHFLFPFLKNLIGSTSL